MQKLNHCLISAAPLLALMVVSLPVAQAQKAPSLSHEDTSFLSDAAQGGLDEVQVGQMAERSATNQNVRNFAKKMIDEHSRLNGELQSLASHKNYKLPDDISIKQKASNKLLSSKNGRSFDDSYVSSMVKDHRDDVQAFEKEASSGEDQDVRAFASKALVTLREHLRMAEDLARELGVKV